MILCAIIIIIIYIYIYVHVCMYLCIMVYLAQKAPATHTAAHFLAALGRMARKLLASCCPWAGFLHGVLCILGALFGARGFYKDSYRKYNGLRFRV